MRIHRVWSRPTARWYEEGAADLRAALRSFASRPGVPIGCILTLALTIGVNVAVYDLVDRALLRPIDVLEPSRLVTVARSSESESSHALRFNLSWDYASRLSGIAAFESVALTDPSYLLPRTSRRLEIALEGAATDVAVAQFVTWNYFRVLGVIPALGRDFEAADDLPGAELVVILTHQYWRTGFSSDAAVIGRPVRINDSIATVIGVAPRSFHGTVTGGAAPGVFIPLFGGAQLVQPEFAPRFVALARLAHDLRHSQSEVRTTLGGDEWDVVRLTDVMLPFETRAELEQFLLLLASATGLILLIGCANLAGLLLARSDERTPELAIRAALGAGRGRLLRQLAVEIGLLAAAGVVGAVVVASHVNEALFSFVLPGGIAISGLRESTGARVLFFAMFAAAAAAILIGLVPATRAWSRHLAVSIKGQARGSSRMGLSRMLIGVQVTVCVVLVFGAALFVQSVSNALSTDLGFNADGLVSVALEMPSRSELEAKGDMRYGVNALDALAEHARAFPAVTAATAGPLPLVRGSDFSYGRVYVDGVPQDLAAPLDVVFAGSNYFRTLGQAVLRGRDFDEWDRPGARGVAIINEAAARQFWRDDDPLERQISVPAGFLISGPGQRVERRREFVIVGVVRDAKVSNLRMVEPVMYLPRLQHQDFIAGITTDASASVILRTTGHIPELRLFLAQGAATFGVGLQDVTTLRERINELVMPELLGRILLLLLGSAALALMVAGIYGMLATVLVRHQYEFGVRMALGAGPRDIVRSVLDRMLLPLAGGIVFGGLLAWSLGHVADRFMYGITGSDLKTIGIAVLVILATASIAAARPVYLALRINPVETLRAE